MTHPATRQRVVNAPGLYHTHAGDVFLPGAGNAVFEPAFALPILQLIGAAIYAGNSPNPLQRQVIFATQAAPMAGLGGLVSGQLITQPLNAPDEPGNGTM